MGGCFLILNPSALRSEVKRILVIRFARLGDVVLLVPMLRELRNHFPHAELDVLVDHRYAPVLEMCSAVSQAIAVDRLEMRDSSKVRALGNILALAERLRRRRYDLVLDCHSFRETHLLTWYSRARWRLGLKRVHSPFLSSCFNLDPVPEDDSRHVSAVFLSMLEPLGILAGAGNYLLDLPPESLRKAERVLCPYRVTGNEWFVGFNVGAGSRSRTWPEEKFTQLAERILQQPSVRIILFSGPQEDEISWRLRERLQTERVILAMNLPLPDLAALLSKCGVLVSNDTGPMHLGVASGVPTLGLFSVARPEHYRPLGSLSRYLRGETIDAIAVDRVHAEFLQIQALLSRSRPTDFAQ